MPRRESKRGQRSNLRLILFSRDGDAPHAQIQVISLLFNGSNKSFLNVFLAQGPVFLWVMLFFFCKVKNEGENQS